MDSFIISLSREVIRSMPDFRRQKPAVRSQHGELALSRSIKILSMGDGCVGKSCLIKRYCEKKFVNRYIATIGIDYGVKRVTTKARQQTVKVNFWDVSGHPEFLEIRNEFYRDTQGALLVFDVTCRDSFEKLDSWLGEARKFGLGEAAVLVVGNKVDLEEQRVVSPEEAQRWADYKKFQYYETSCKTGLNIDKAFERLFDAVVETFDG